MKKFKKPELSKIERMTRIDDFISSQQWLAPENPEEYLRYLKLDPSQKPDTTKKIISFIKRKGEVVGVKINHPALDSTFIEIKQCKSPRESEWDGYYYKCTKSIEGLGIFKSVLLVNVDKPYDFSTKSELVKEFPECYYRPVRGKKAIWTNRGMLRHIDVKMPPIVHLAYRFFNEASILSHMSEELRFEGFKVKAHYRARPYEGVLENRTNILLEVASDKRPSFPLFYFRFIQKDKTVSEPIWKSQIEDPSTEIGALDFRTHRNLDLEYWKRFGVDNVIPQTLIQGSLQDMIQKFAGRLKKIKEAEQKFLKGSERLRESIPLLTTTIDRLAESQPRFKSTTIRFYHQDKTGLSVDLPRDTGHMTLTNSRNTKHLPGLVVSIHDVRDDERASLLEVANVLTNVTALELKSFVKTAKKIGFDTIHSATSLGTKPQLVL
jgi:hypothetical protein